MDELRLGMHSHREDELRSFAGATVDVMVVFVFITVGQPWPRF